MKYRDKAIAIAGKRLPVKLANKANIVERLGEPHGQALPGFDLRRHRQLAV